MTEVTFAVLMLLILGWAVVSDRLARWNITGPLLVFSVFGFALANQDWGPLTVDVQAPSDPPPRRTDAGTPAVLGRSEECKPLHAPSRHRGTRTSCSASASRSRWFLGSLAAAWLFHDFTWALAGFVGAALAPTDAALQRAGDQR